MYHNVKRDDHALKTDDDLVSCDLCGITIYQPTPFGKPVLNPTIREAYGSAAHAQVSLSKGEDDADIHAGETSHYDICPKCFEEKLKPWFDGQGAKAKLKQWSS